MNQNIKQHIDIPVQGLYCILIIDVNGFPQSILQFSVSEFIQT